MRHNVSLMRHGFTRCYDPGPGASVATLAWEYAPDFHVPLHAHGSDQVIHATRGVMEVSSGQRMWLIPPQFAIWIPAGTMHSIRMPGAVSMRTLYFRKGSVRKMPPECSVLHVSPLLRELIVEAVRIGELKTRNRVHAALRNLTISAVESASTMPTSILLPEDSRGLDVARAILADPGARMLPLCRAAGVSARTLERLFRSQVGVSFEAWRRQVRLIRGIELLAAGTPVKDAAYSVGYQQSSAFVQMFRKTMGVSPKAWAVLATKAALPLNAD